MGDGPALSEESIVEDSIVAENVFHAMALTPDTASTIRGLKELNANHLAVMHGTCFSGKCASELEALAEYAEQAMEAALSNHAE